MHWYNQYLQERQDPAPRHPPWPNTTEELKAPLRSYASEELKPPLRSYASPPRRSAASGTSHIRLRPALPGEGRSAALAFHVTAAQGAEASTTHTFCEGLGGPHVVGADGVASIALLPHDSPPLVLPDPLFFCSDSSGKLSQQAYPSHAYTRAHTCTHT